MATAPDDPSNEPPACGITDLAREFRITARTIRFYEDQGLLAPTRCGAGLRTRIYSARDRARLQLVLRGKRLGLSLAAIRDLLDMYETSADTVPQLQRYLAVLEERRDALRRQWQDLTQTLDDIETQRAQAVRLLGQLQAGQAAARPALPGAALRPP